MILVRDIRLPLSAGEPQAFEKALHLARIPRSKAAHLGVAKLSVDARHCQPRLVYTVAVTLKDEGEESAFAGASPCVALRSRTDFSVRNGTEPLARRGCSRRCCWPGRATAPSCWSAARRWTSG